MVGRSSRPRGAPDLTGFENLSGLCLPMHAFDITALRLQNQHLARPDFDDPHAVVSHFCAVQAQDYAAAKWSVGLRMRRATDAAVESAFNAGAILRTHVMRPTWHFVAPEDIRSVLSLTAPRVHAANAAMYRRLELDARLLSRCHAVFRKALSKSFLTRQELASKLTENGIVARGQRLAYIVMHAELEGVICSGPRRGKQFTYALLDERVPKVKTLPRDEALARLTLKYFTSHGPAQVKDFAWWSGLSLKEAREGLESVKSHLVQESVDDKVYWFAPTQRTVRRRSSAYLLSVFDEYTIAYTDRSALGDERPLEKLLLLGAAFTAVIIMDGKIAGTWKRQIGKD